MKFRNSQKIHTPEFSLEKLFNTKVLFNKLFNTRNLEKLSQVCKWNHPVYNILSDSWFGPLGQSTLGRLVYD